MKNKITVCILLFFIILESCFIYIAETMTVFSLKKNVFTFEYGTFIPTNPDYYVNCSHNIKDSIQLNLNKVQTKTGTYSASVTYINKTYDFKIIVEDNTRPHLDLKKIVYKIQAGEILYASKIETQLKKSSKSHVYFLYSTESESLVKYKKYNQMGTYIERVLIVDKNGNKSQPKRVKIIVSRNKIKPVIKGVSDITIALGSSFDPYSGISVYDDLDGNLTSKIKIKGQVDTLKKGEYTLTYSATDSSGNTAVKKRKVSVK